MHTSNTAETDFPSEFLTIEQLTADQLHALLDRAWAVKAGKDLGRLQDATVAMLFEKPSTRTRVSFESGVVELGAHPTFLGPEEIHLGHGEPLKDTARALSQYVDAIVARVFDHEDLVELGAYADVPVVNALTDASHPCQTLADLLTLREIGGEDPTVAWVGDGNNVANSLVVGCAMTGVDLRVATPDGYGIDEDTLKTAESFGGAPTLTASPEAAVDGADAVYTDVWISMGESAAREAKLPAFEGYQVTEELLAGTDAKFMHCLPAVRGEEVTDEVLEGERSVVWQQARNRKPVQQALLLELLGQ
ncbi:ornithine carbamoyltransferase [Halolamina sp.]|uniref:ornithine carbamoyltransferase n=1 Tax=Halolamina sp. TaxID=1940283 RepID=UPI0035660040